TNQRRARREPASLPELGQDERFSSTLATPVLHLITIVLQPAELSNTIRSETTATKCENKILNRVRFAAIAVRDPQRTLDTHEVPHRVTPVDQAVVVRQCEVHHGPNNHRIIPNNSPLLNRVHPEDGALWRIQYRRR